MKSVEVADIVKFSDENVPDLTFCDEYMDKLFIQTQGARGLLFNLCGKGWKHVQPRQVSNVVDWEGCGDTITAVFINEIAKLGLPKVAELTEEQVENALIAATGKAALCTQYYGSKGWIKTLL